MNVSPCFFFSKTAGGWRRPSTRTLSEQEGEEGEAHQIQERRRLRVSTWDSGAGRTGCERTPLRFLYGHQPGIVNLLMRKISKAPMLFMTLKCIRTSLGLTNQPVSCRVELSRVAGDSEKKINCGIRYVCPDSGLPCVG